MRRPCFAGRVLMALLILAVGALPNATASAAATSAPGTSAAAQSRRGVGTVPVAVAASSRRVAKDRHRRLLVRLAQGTSSTDLATLYRSLDTSSGAVEELGGGTLAWRVPAGVAMDEFAARLEKSGKVVYAEPNHERHLAEYVPPQYLAPNDPDFKDATKYYYGTSSTNPTNLFPYGKSWWLRDVRAPEAWSEGFTGPVTAGRYPLRASGETVKVAVLDTGYWSPSSPEPHPEMAANVSAGWDFFDGDGNVAPPNPSELIREPSAERTRLASHGTCVAGIIAAQVNNGEGSAGVGYDTQVVVYKIAGVRAGKLSLSDDAVIQAINRAVTDGCDVINMSFVGSAESPAMQDAIDHAWSHGCILVAAAGNSGKPVVGFPARGSHVVSVSALTKNATGAKTQSASWSNYGSGLDMSAPGAMIWGLSYPAGPDYGYAWWDGTSMASPIVAGGLALLWRAMPSLTGDQVVSYAKSTATDLGAAGYDTRTGAGELNLIAAYRKLEADYPLLAATAQISVPATASVRGVPISWSAVAGYRVSYDVTLDGVAIASVSSPEFNLPALPLGTHRVTITPRSSRNWSDSRALKTRTITVNADVPVGLSLRFDGDALRWTSTESSAVHSDLLWVDGDLKTVTGGLYRTDALALGNHTATFAVVDAAGVQSDPISITFRTRPEPSVTRLSGSDRYAANVTLSRSVFTSATTAVLVSGQTWPDALSAGPLAAKLGGPVLLTNSGSLTPVTANELARLNTKHVVVVGGPNSVSSAVIASLRARDMTVERVWGTNRYSTADAVARTLARRGDGSVGRAVVVSGDTFTDALVASVVAAKMGWPVLLSTNAAVPSGTLATIAAIQATSTIVVGGTASVSDAAKAQLPGASRISATTSSGVAVQLAEWATRTYPSDFPLEGFYLASNTAYADGLGVGAAAARSGSLLLLTPPTLVSETRAYYTAHHNEAVTTRVVGGPATLPDSVMNTVKSIVGAP